MDAAVADYKAALDINPSMAYVYCNLADIYVAQGDLEMAVQILQQGIAVCGEDETLLARAAELGYGVADGQVLTNVTADEYADVQVPEVPQAWIDFQNELHDYVDNYDYRNDYEPLTPELEEYLSRYIDLALNSDNTLDLSRIIDLDFLDRVSQDYDYWHFWSTMNNGAIVELDVWMDDSEERTCYFTYCPQNGDGFDWKYAYMSEVWHYGSLSRAGTVDCVFDGNYTRWHRGVYEAITGESYSEWTGTLSMGWLDGVTTCESWGENSWHDTGTLTYENGYMIESSNGGELVDDRRSLVGIS